MSDSLHHRNILHRQFVLIGIAGCLVLLIMFGATLETYQAQVDPTQQQFEILQTTVAALLNPRITLTSRAFELQTVTIAAQQERTSAGIETHIASTSAYVQTVTVLALTATFTPSGTPTPAIDATQQFNTLIADVAQRFTATQRSLLTQTATVGYAYTVNSIILQTLGITATITPSATFTPSTTATASSTPTPSDTPTPTSTPTAAVKLQVVQSDSVQVQRRGQWQVFQSDFANGSSFVVSGEEGNESLALSFRGTSVDVVYVKAPQLGLFAVEVDGKWVQTVDSNAAKSEFDVHVKIRGLKLETHRIRVYAMRGSFAIDAFVIEPED